MSFFRSHILKTITTFVLLAGIVLYYAKPNHSNAKYSVFTSWLSSYLKDNDNETDILDKINELSTVEDEPEAILKNVSEFISNNTDSFDFDTNEVEKEDIYSYLLKKWTSYMSSQQGMAKGVIVTNSKVNAIQQKDSHSSSTTLLPAQQKVSTTYQTQTDRVNLIQFNNITSPLSFGIVIGAP